MNWLKRWRGEKMGKPKIRFKGYTEDWEQRKLSDIYGSIGNAFVGTATPYYAEQGHFYLESNNVKDGQINHNSEVFINDEFYEKQKDKWLHTGDMVMVQSGHVGHAAVISEELDNTAAHALIMFRNPKEEIEPYFLNYEYQTDKAKKKIENITTGNTIKHILASDMQEFVVDVPKYEEQKVIADYFRNLDHLITLHQQKCDETKKLKKCMLQKMFPKEGEKVPEIRFSGFTGDWKQRKLGDVAEIIGGGTPKTSINDYWDGEINWYAPAEIGNLIYVSSSQRKITKLGLNKSSAKILPVGTVLFTSRAGIGKTAILACEGCTNQGFQSIVPRKGMLDSYFIFVRTEELKRYAETVGAGSTFVEVSGKQMTDMELMLPITIEEQQKIGNYFAEIDSLITFHQQRCDELKNIKKFMLQNMFVSEK